MSYNSKYKGSEVDNLLSSIKDKQDVIPDLVTIREGSSKGATALQEEQYKGTVTSVTAGEGLAGGTITGSGIISLEEKAQNGKFIDLMSKVDILEIGNTSSDTNITIDNTSSVWMDKMLNFDKFGRLNGIDGYYYYPTKVTFGEATTSLKGLMSASDKAKLDGIDLTGKQDTLVSGTNIKTINGQSLLGSGNIVIEGGSSSGGGGGAYAEVSHGTSDTTFTLTPNTFHVWDEVASLDLSFAEETAGVANEYLFQFTSGATATTLTLPDGLKWANDTPPTIVENMIYQISVLKGLASVLEFSNKGLFPITLYYADVPNDTYAKVYQELINRGTSGVLEPGLLFVNYDDIVVEVTEYSYFNDYRGLFLYSFGDPVYYDIYLASDGSMSQMFND